MTASAPASNSPSSITAERGGLQILVVDEQRHQRDLLRFMLEEAGHHCFEAHDAEQAVSCWQAHAGLDLVIIDVHLPEAAALAAARRIKSESQANDQCRPLAIIILAPLDDAAVYSRCVEAGADAVVPKPVRERLLLWQIQALGRHLSVRRDLQTAHTRLQLHQHHLERELRVVEQLYNNSLSAVATRCENLTAHYSAIALFNGDLMLTAPSPAGGLYVVVGSFPGRGLTAAVGALPAMRVFFNAVRRQCAISELARELNRELYHTLPRGMYCCATLLHLDGEGQQLSLWAGGTCDTLYLSADGRTVTAFGADHLPLGVLPADEFDDCLQLLDLAYGGHLYLCTDGLVMARAENDESFGEQRYRTLLTAAAPRRVAQTVRAVQAYQGARAQRDTFSLVEIHCAPLVHRHKITQEIIDMPAARENVSGPAWELHVRLQAADLRRPEPLAQMFTVLQSTPAFEFCQDKLITILSELFSNAVDHGVLGLDTTDRAAAGGFERYNRMRAERLATLEQGTVEVTLEYQAGGVGCVWVKVTDSGPGFAPESVLTEGAGRGLTTLRKLCGQLTYRDGGRSACARFDLRTR